MALLDKVWEEVNAASKAVFLRAEVNEGRRRLTVAGPWPSLGDSDRALLFTCTLEARTRKLGVWARTNRRKRRGSDYLC